MERLTAQLDGITLCGHAFVGAWLVVLVGTWAGLWLRGANKGRYLTAPIAAQTRTNPEVSVIGDIRAYTHSDTSRAEEHERLNLADPQVELFISGYLNPYAQAAATIAWHEGGSGEIEEAYGTILRGLARTIAARS